MKKADVYYKALITRDQRFDGKFFVGVKTTGIYCRPICPAKPKQKNVEFFKTRLEAERAGYRPCLRCRPESAPRSAAWIGKSALVQRAVKMLGRQETIDFNEDQMAEQFGVTARHLRRVVVDEIGKTPKQLAFENRLGLAQKLIRETQLSSTEVAYASGFKSIRQFNASFKKRFKKNPSSIRKVRMSSDPILKISVPYQHPFHFNALLEHYRGQQMGDLESFEKDKMYRIVSFDKSYGQIAISDQPKKSSVLVEIDFPDPTKIDLILARVRSMFDLDSDPLIIANALEIDEHFKKMVKKHPGLRLPSGWDPFELAISTILGQLVSVQSARSLVRDLIQLTGTEITFKDKKIKLFPTPQQLAEADLEKLKTTKIRKRTLKNFSQALVDQTLSLEPTQDVEKFIADALTISGIGPWTANYMALKCLRHTDAFPGSDLILARALQIHPRAVIQKMSPWQGYAAILLWREYAGILKKEKSK